METKQTSEVNQFMIHARTVYREYNMYSDESFFKFLGRSIHTMNNWYAFGIPKIYKVIIDLLEENHRLKSLLKKQKGKNIIENKY